jgi:CRISPR/Cas system CSM-associated protein Csm3 (group 7 of RAMP superfamily)
VRDVNEYIRQGRNDPSSPEQMAEHPYDFVSLPERPAVAKPVYHDRYHPDRLSGKLTLTYRIESPLHVGSGVFETAEQCGFQGGQEPVRGIVRRCGAPVLPGSSWKGAVRARFEAITRSRLALVSTFSREQGWKVPAVLGGGSGQGKLKVTITDERVTDTLGAVRCSRKACRLSPAESVFGCMGYRGRVGPQDGIIKGGSAQEPLSVPPLDGPLMHRLAAPGHVVLQHGRLEISQVEGRKFYYDGDVVSSRTGRDGRSSSGASELIDVVAPGGSITIVIRLDSLSEPEMGALLVAAGYGIGVGVVRFGGYKSAGLGKVKLEQAQSEVWRGVDSRGWKRSKPEQIDLDDLVSSATQQLIDGTALAELHSITTRRR